MPSETSSRRSFLSLSFASIFPGAIAMRASALGANAQSDVHVPWSAGTERPKLQAPPNAADCHHHIYDSRFAADPKAALRPGNASVRDYRLLQKRLGTTRNVIVQPSTYGVDNRCLLDALAQFGTSATRGVAVVNTTVKDNELRRMHAAGVRGIRFNVVQAGATTLDMVEPLAKHIADLGWHIQINASPEQIARSNFWSRIPCPVVFDHLGHVSQAGDPAFKIIAGLLQRGNGWVKLSGAYLDSKTGPPSYGDRTPVAQAYIREAPQRMVWGSDWPHPTTQTKPDDAILLDLLAEWAPDEANRRRILVDNPAELYQFGR
jgi:predicted TIM-barrel fold metal-dependent hydrolase